MDYKQLKKEAEILTPGEKFEAFLFEQLKFFIPRAIIFYIIVFAYSWIYEKYGIIRVFLSMFAVFLILAVDFLNVLSNK